MRYDEKPQITEQEIREAMDFSTAQVKRNLPEFTTKFQKAYSENGFYAPTDNVDWTTGFWTGERSGCPTRIPGKTSIKKLVKSRLTAF